LTTDLFWPGRALDGWQRLQVFGHASAILRAQLRCVLDHARHRTAGAVAVRHLPSLKKISDILLAPVANAFLGDVGHPTLAFRVWAAGESLRGDNATEEVPRAVTLRAMADAANQIGAAIPARRARRARRARPMVHERQ